MADQFGDERQLKSKYIPRRADRKPEPAFASERVCSDSTFASANGWVAAAPRADASPASSESALKSSYISRRQYPKEAHCVPLNVMDFNQGSICEGAAEHASLNKRGSIHGEGNCQTWTADELARVSLVRSERLLIDDAQQCQTFAETVFLNIYDLGDSKAIHKLNVVLKPFGGGAFHAAVQLFDQEWSFGGLGGKHANEDDGFESGIWSCSPQMCQQHTFRESIALGTTTLSYIEVLRVLCDISADWPMNGYDLLRRNCCHFCDQFCRLLGVGPLPDWVLNLANVGAALDDGFAHVAAKVRLAMSTANKLKLRPRLG